MPSLGPVALLPLCENEPKFFDAHARISISPGKETAPTLAMPHMKGLYDLEIIFDALGLDLIESTAEEAVLMIGELITAYAAQRS